MMHAVLFTSLSCDPVIELFSIRSNAERRMKDILVREGWPEAAARDAAVKGSAVAVNDRGDDDTVRISDLSIKDR